MIRANVDPPEIFPPQSAFVRERTHDLPRRDVLTTPDRDPVGRQIAVAAGAARTVTTACGAVVAFLTLLAPAAELLGSEVGLRVQQQGLLALHDGGQRRGHVHLGNVELVDVVVHHVAEEVDPRVVAQRRRDRLVEAGQAGGVDVFHAGQGHGGERLAGDALDGAQLVALAGGDERDGVAAASRTAGAPDAVHIAFGVGGDVEVHHMADAVDVEAAGGHIGRDEDVELAALELPDGALASGLGQVAVDGGCGPAACPQLLGERFRLVLGADEHDHPVEVLDLKDARERVHLARVGDDRVAVGDVGGCRRLALDHHFERVDQVGAGQRPDLTGHGGGEQRHLLVRGGVGQDLLDVLSEAHVEHLVGLIEHEEPQLRQVEGAALQVVDDASRGAHHHVDAAGQRSQLDAVALAAVHGQQTHLQVRGVRFERLADLKREFAGGSQHERLRVLVLAFEPLQDRQREGGGLAGTGLGEADDVTASQQCGDRFGLDRGGLLVAQLLQRLEDLRL